MNRSMVPKKSSPRSNEISVQSISKRGKKQKTMSPPVSKKYKGSRISKVKKIAKNSKLMNECAENESSKGEIYEKPRLTRNMKKTLSSESVIYVGNYKDQSNHRRNIPVIDLTESTESIANKENIYPKKLKTLYFPQRNFDRASKCKKCLTTTSLITLPVTRKLEVPKKHTSTDDLINKCNKSKLAILNIPPQYLDLSDLSIGENRKVVVDKAKLTDSDYEMIDWIIEHDRDVEMDISLSPSTSGCDSSLDTGMSIEEFVSVYDGVYQRD